MNKPIQPLKTTVEPIGILIPDPDNAREHPERNREALVRSIQRFGIRKPVVAHEGSNIVYAGNETLRSAIELGIDELPVAWIPKKTPVEVCKAYALADNRTSSLAEWNLPQLEKIVAELEDIPDLELEDVGFALDELEQITGNNGNISLSDVEFKEYDESIADDVKMIECPHCGKEFPK